MNIASNARDASAAGGRLWIDVKAVETAPESLNLSEKDAHSGGYVCISFRDNGAGIPPDILKRVFDPFFTTKQVGQGTGLGLSMVYGFAHQSNGAVAIESRLEVGTTVLLYLPRVATDDDTPLEDPVVFRKSDTDGLAALLVEDNDPLRDLTKRQLERLGFVVTTARDGGSAIEQLGDKGPFDLLVLDIILPGGIDGVEIARRAFARNPKSRVVFCTGFADVMTQDLPSPFADAPVLLKPFMSEEFESAVARAWP